MLDQHAMLRLSECKVAGSWDDAVRARLRSSDEVGTVRGMAKWDV
jgi:hypothetical protein